MKNKYAVLNTYYHNLTMEETLNSVFTAIETKKQVHHVVINAGKVVALQEDDKLKTGVNEADIINVDGQAVVWAIRFLGLPIKERVAGIDLMENIIKNAAHKHYTIFFLGAKEAVVQKVVAKVSDEYGKEIIAGYRNGYFSDDEDESVAKQIENSGAQVLFVAISSPKKEIFLQQQKKHLKNVNFFMGVGGSFDVYSGLIKRAPRWMQKMGLEWFYRFMQEPQRMWKRYLVGNTKFVFLVLKEKFKRK